MQPLQNSVWTLVSGWCRHHWHQLPATFYTTPSLCCTYHTVVQVGILQTCFRACRPQRAKGHLGSLLGFESLHPVYDYEPAALSLSQHHTRLYEFAEAVSQCSEPSWHWCVLAVFHCYIRSHRSIPMLFNTLHDVRHTCKWLWHLNRNN